ncbi:MAG: LacI family transcription regulator [Acidobacteria bacterium]|nr:LacI family transcription regulator [Acidobacteriota bacterium]
MPITIKDIARQAKVSHSTVSRALSGSPLISDLTADRVRQTALELGYLPSAAARSLKTKRSQALGVIIRNVDDPFFGEILQGIEEVAQGSGYSLFMAALNRANEHDQRIIQAMVERRVDGLIICSTPVSIAQSRQLASYGVPIVVINNQSAEEYRYSIYHDDVDGSRQITRHLINLGHRKIAYLGNSTAGRSTLDRLAGFRQEFEAARLLIQPSYILQVPGGGPENGYFGLKQILNLPELPTALVCYNDMMAIGVLKGLQEAGIRVPEMLSVTGFDNIRFSAYTNPPLTTFDQPKQSIGAEAARLVLGLLKPETRDEKSGAPEIRRLRGRLLVRDSTAVPGKV